MIARYAVSFFIFMAFIVAPLAVFLMCRYFLPRRWGKKVGVCLAALMILFGLYGMFVGYQQLDIRHVEYSSRDLPEAFDGYRIVQFSDAHIGTMTHNRKWLLERAVDSILAQKGDMIVFTGDLQNVYPEELEQHQSQLQRLKAPDGVYSVLGNHDYAIYQPLDDAAKEANCRKTQEWERKVGWNLLMNEHRIIRRDSDSIVIGGMENWGTVKRMPRRGDVRKTLAGVNPASFVVMLQHDPTAWRELILPQCNAQLTLSGHTHGGQLQLFGLRPSRLLWSEDSGLYSQGHQRLYVTTGLGGVFRFRFNVPPEVVVITLRKS